MSISLKADASGTTGSIQINGTDAVSITTSGFPFCKNKLFNGEVTRINQRGFDGNWTPKGTWSAGNTIAQQELCYGYDMWAKASATDMVQPIEAGNYRPSTVHTISGLNMTTRQETSPASGNWNIVVPQAARNVQVEEGTVATPFEIRPISFELVQCQRYYWQVPANSSAGGYPRFGSTGTAGYPEYIPIQHPVRMRVVPSVDILAPAGWFTSNAGNVLSSSETQFTTTLYVTPTAVVFDVYPGAGNIPLKVSAVI